MYPFIYSN
jgi:Ran GTPase-activating protein 1